MESVDTDTIATTCLTCGRIFESPARVPLKDGKPLPTRGDPWPRSRIAYRNAARNLELHYRLEHRDFKVLPFRPKTQEL